MLSVLKELGLSDDGIKFQCYDTTSSMSGIYNGAQAKLSSKVKRKVPYVSCLGHKTNLCVEHSCDESVMVTSFLQRYRNCTTSLPEVRLDLTCIKPACMKLVTL